MLTSFISFFFFSSLHLHWSSREVKFSGFLLPEGLLRLKNDQVAKRVILGVTELSFRGLGVAAKRCEGESMKVCRVI